MSERIDDLEIGGFKIIQDTALFCYGMDAVLLSAYARAGKKDKCIDFCTGNGVVPLLMYAKGKGVDWTALELQERCAKLAEKNMNYNNVADYIEVINGDICDIPKNCLSISKRDGMHKIVNEGHLQESMRDRFNVVTCNPPYMKEATGYKNPNSAIAIARHEIACDFGDVARATSYVLKLKGRAYFVHRPKHLISILHNLREAHLEPKKIRYVHSYIDSPATLVLIEAVKGGGEELMVESPLIVYESEGVYTEELLKLYGKC